MFDVRMIHEDDPLCRDALASLAWEGGSANLDHHIRLLVRRITHHRRFIPAADSLIAAVESGRVVAAALSLELPGRFATVILSPGSASHPPFRAAASSLLASLTQHCRRRGIRMVEAIDVVDDSHRGRIWNEAGFQFVSRLTCMGKNLKMSGLPWGVLESPPTRRTSEPDPFAPFSSADLGMFRCRSERKWVPYADCDHDDVVALYAETRRDSYDFPELTALRSADVAVASHQIAGDSETQMWWVLREQHQSVGLVFLSKHEALESVEVVYLGVAPQYRGRDVGRALLEYAIRRATQENAAHMSLAVDHRNLPAQRLYARAGFHVLTQRDVWLKILD